MINKELLNSFPKSNHIISNDCLLNPNKFVNNVDTVLCKDICNLTMKMKQMKF